MTDEAQSHGRGLSELPDPGPNEPPGPASDGGPPHTDEKVVPLDAAVGKMAARNRPKAGVGARRLPKGVMPVSGIIRDALDHAGNTIIEVFAKKSGVYAIYKTAAGIMVHFADDPKIAEQQRRHVDTLSFLRSRLAHLIHGYDRTEFYDHQLATALRLAIIGDTTRALAILEDAVNKATEQRYRDGRLYYLRSAAVVSAGLALALLAASGLLGWSQNSGAALLLAAGGGSLGALLSIAIGIRSRTVAPDFDFITNSIDGALRVVIGVLGAGALHLLLASGILPSSLVTGRWETILFFGFAAGFFERLVPDLLEQNRPFAETKRGEPTPPGA